MNNILWLKITLSASYYLKYYFIGNMQEVNRSCFHGMIYIID